MKTLTPQNLTHRGTVLAGAFLLSAKILSESEMRRRVLKLWQDGSNVFRRGDDLIIALSQPQRVDASRTIGLSFVRYGQLLSAFPLRKNDLESFQNFNDSLLFLENGKLEIIRLSELISEKVEEWFDVSIFETLETKSLGSSKPPNVRVMKPLSEDDLNLRQELKAIPKASPELAGMLEKLRAIKEERENNKSGSFFSQLNSASGGGTAVASFLTSFLGNLKGMFSSNQLTSDSEFGRSGGANASNYQESGSSVLSTFYNRLRQMRVNAVVSMRLARIFGHRQAKYLAEMMEKFERGDLTEALKYAIPLEDMQVLQELIQKPPTLFAPRPRGSLNISFGRNAGGSSINLEAQWFEHLRQLYRQSFERLEAQGKFEEAAFVLAELLKSNAEAVEFLSRHGKHRVAAELAEARNLPKETIVRQWFLAGEKMRAVRLAVLHNCFEYAVTKLEAENSVIGTELRELWAESLAQTGNYPAAVDVVWKLEDKRLRAKEWIEKTIEFGGVAGARMLARKAMLFPENFDEIKRQFGSITEGDDFEAIEKRNNFARTFFKQTINAEVRTLLRPLIRRIISDASRTSHSLQLKEFRELVTMAKDNTLRTDLPVYPQLSPVLTVSKCLEITIAGQDKGASVIYDACPLPDGKILIALGEAGIKILSRNGKQIAFFDQPARKLVISDFSNKVIALAPRGDSWRLAKIDLTDRQANFWCNAQISSFASSFDGSTWFVGIKDGFFAIDAKAEDLEAVWSVDEVGGISYATVRSNSQAKFLTLSNSGFETWSYALPDLTLRQRSQRKWLDETKDTAFMHQANISEGAYSVVLMMERSDRAEDWRFYANIFDHEHLAAKFDFPPETVRLNRPEIFSQYSVIVAYTEAHAIVYVFLGAGKIAATFKLIDAAVVATKFNENFLTITDDCGRLLVYDYKNQVIKQNLRL